MNKFYKHFYMTSNIQNTGFKVGSDSFDIANMVTCWSHTDNSGNRIIPTSSTGLNIFPQFGYGFSSTTNGQIVTIYNITNTNITIYVYNAQVFYNGVYYSPTGINNFIIGGKKGATFVLLHGMYYVQIAYYNI